MNTLIRLVVVHGYCMLRPGLIEMLQREAQFEVCSVVPSLEDISEEIYQHRPDLILVNIAPKCSCGVTSLRRLRQDFSSIRILTFSCNMEFEDMLAGVAIRSGADGYVSSADDPSDLMVAIRTVSSGRQHVSPQVRQKQSQLYTLIPQFDALSKREAEVFCLIGCGHVTKRIAEMIGINVKTVESYRERIRTKLDIPSGADLLYMSVSFMRSAARRGIAVSDDHLGSVREWLSTIG